MTLTKELHKKYTDLAYSTVNILGDSLGLEKDLKIKRNARELIKKGKLSKKWRIRKRQIKKMPSLL